MKKLDQSQLPPNGLAVEEVPQFIAFGFDDNGYSGLVPPNEKGGITWAMNMFHNLKNPAGKGNPGTFDGTSGRATFYFTTLYIDSFNIEPADYVKKAWNDAYKMGHEMGNHTHSHPNGEKFEQQEWADEIEKCFSWIEKPAVEHVSDIPEGDWNFGAGIPRSAVTGFRSPFLNWSPNLFPVLGKKGFQYDCSIGEGDDEDQDGTNFVWPYEFKGGHSAKQGYPEVPGLYELPCYHVIAPPDEECEKYGVAKGLRKKISESREWYDAQSGKIGGLDWDLFCEAELNKAECLAVLKYTLDLRLKGNRSPMLFGGHTDLYSESNPFPKYISAPERRELLEEFLEWALKKPEVRVVAMQDVLDWIKKPVSL